MIAAHTMLLSWGMTLAGVAYIFLIFWPTVRIMHRIGRSGWWSLLIVAGPGAIIGLWLLAYTRWPALEQKSAEESP
jgi:hypothetical protein